MRIEIPEVDPATKEQPDVMTVTKGRLANETMCQLFFDGPVWDGNLASKTGRDVLVDLGLAERGAHGLQWLTRKGVERAIVLGWHRYKESGPRMSAYEAWKRMF